MAYGHASENCIDLFVKHGNTANKHIIMNNDDKQHLTGQKKKEYGSEL